MPGTSGLVLTLGLAVSGAVPSVESATFLLELQGTPVGTVSLSLQGGRYEYVSRHLYARADDETWVVRKEVSQVETDGRLADGSARPESLWLWRRPKERGCVEVRGELEAKQGEGCVDELGVERARGRLRGQRFEARYERDRLTELKIGAARFRKVPEGVRLRGGKDLFAEGFPIQHAERAGPLRLSPARPLTSIPPSASSWTEAGARALAREVNAQLVSKVPSEDDLREDGGVGNSGSCLAHARRLVHRAKKLGHPAVVVVGLTAEPGEGRAYPHAWVRVWVEGGKSLELDPLILAPVVPETHLPVSDSQRDAGAVWLELLAGRSSVLRVER